MKLFKKRKKNPLTKEQSDYIEECIANSFITKYFRESRLTWYFEQEFGQEEMDMGYKTFKREKKDEIVQ